MFGIQIEVQKPTSTEQLTLIIGGFISQSIHLDGNSLTLEDVIAVARHGAQCELDEQAKESVIASRKIVDDIVREKRVVYGVTTGFGSLCNVSISPEDTVQLQENLIRTHSSGFGDPLPEACSCHHADPYQLLERLFWHSSVNC